MERRLLQSEITPRRNDLMPLYKTLELVTPITGMVVAIRPLPKSDQAMFVNGLISYPTVMNSVSLYDPLANDALKHIGIPKEIVSEANNSFTLEISSTGKYVLVYRKNGSGYLINTIRGGKWGEIEHEIPGISSGEIMSVAPFKDNEDFMKNSGIYGVSFSSQDRYMIIFYKNNDAVLYDTEKRSYTYISKCNNAQDKTLIFHQTADTLNIVNQRGEILQRLQSEYADMADEKKEKQKITLQGEIRDLIDEESEDYIISENGRYAFYLTDLQIGQTTFPRRGRLLNIYDIDEKRKIYIPQTILVKDGKINDQIAHLESSNDLLVLDYKGDVLQYDLNLFELGYADDMDSYFERNGQLSVEIARRFLEDQKDLSDINNRSYHGEWYEFLTGKSGLTPDLIRAAFETRDIELKDGGNVKTAAGVISEIYLAHSGRLNLEKTYHQDRNHKTKVELSDIPHIDKEESEELFARATGVEVHGRTIAITSYGKTVAYKFLRRFEDPSSLVSEAMQMRLLAELKDQLGLKSDFPVPLHDAGMPLRFIRLKYIPEIERSKLNGEVSLNENGAGLAFCFDAPDGYFNYYTSLNKQDATASTEKTLFDLFRLARYGLIHPDLIELFHNTIQRGRSDRGKYIWNVDIVRPMIGRRGAGRLHAWKRAVDYPNFSLSGLRDFAELDQFAKLYDPELSGGHVEHLRDDMNRFDESLREKITLQYFLGNYMLAWILAEGKRAAQNEGLNWRRPHDLSERVRASYETASAGFMGKSFDNMSQFIDWKKLARQMAYFMNGSYSRDAIRPSALRIRIPQFEHAFIIPGNIYGFDKSMTIGDGWCFIDRDLIMEEIAEYELSDPNGFINDFFEPATSSRRQIPNNIMVFRSKPDPRDLGDWEVNMEQNIAWRRLAKKYGREHQPRMRANGRDEDLGPMNGPLPLTEMIAANYLLTTILIDDACEKGAD